MVLSSQQTEDDSDQEMTGPPPEPVTIESIDCTEIALVPEDRLEGMKEILLLKDG